MTSHNPRRSQLVAVPSSNILEKASASERVFWPSISDAVQSNTEDRNRDKDTNQEHQRVVCKAGRRRASNRRSAKSP